MTRRHHRPRPVTYIKPIQEEVQDDPDIIAVTAYIVIGNDTDGQWVGGFVRGCANLKPGERLLVIDDLTAKTRRQIHDLQSAR